MRDRYLFNPLIRLGSSGDVVDRVENFGAVVSNSACITDADYNSFENDKTLLVLEGFAGDLLSPNGALAVLTPIAVRILFSALRGFHKL